MLARCVTTLVSLASSPGCEDARPAVTPAPAIAARAAGADADLARVSAGPPCRARIGDHEVITSGLPLVAAVGTAQLTTAADTDGITFLRDGQPLGRLGANQLFDAAGEALVRVTADGAVLDARGATVAHAAAGADHVTITPSSPGPTVTVTHTTDVVLAAMLVARDAGPELRALVACQLALATSAPSPGRAGKE